MVSDPNVNNALEQNGKEKMDDIDFEYMIDCFKEELQEIGFVDPEIQYSISFSQGDGLSFTSDYINIEKILNTLIMIDYKHIPYFSFKDYYHRFMAIEKLRQYNIVDFEIDIRRDCYTRYSHELTCYCELYVDSWNDSEKFNEYIINTCNELISIIEQYRIELCCKYKRILENILLNEKR